MRKSIITFGFLVSLSRALFSPVPCVANLTTGAADVAGQAVSGLAGELAKFGQCFAANLDHQINSNPDIV